MQRNLNFNSDTDTAQSWDGMAEAMERAEGAAGALAKQLTALSTGCAVIGLLSAAFRTLEAVMGKSLKANAQYQAELGRLKGAMTDAFTPIFNFILPGLLALMRILSAVFSLIGSIFGVVSGGRSNALDRQSRSIRGVGRAAKEAKKDLANFDEINRLGQTDYGGAGGGGGSLGTEDFPLEEYKAKIDELAIYLSGALLALGAILAFSGANIPLGIGLMAVGAIGLASVVRENWDCMPAGVRQALTNVALVLGGAALAIGVILAFSGANIPLGIGLMAAGAAALASAAALDWNSVVTALQGPIGLIFGIASAAMLVLGLILVCSGVGIPLGIALMAAGAVGLVSVAALNWNAIQEKLATTWAGIKQWYETHVKKYLTLEFWQEKFNNIALALERKVKDGVNAAIALMNRFIKWVNEKMTLKWSDFSVGGVHVIDAGSFQLLNIPSIPMLAKGAVLPANKPFLSIVGDQKNGTNIEAPLETIQQALAQVLSGYTPGVNISFTGDLAQLARILKPVIDTENRRVGGSLSVKGGSV